MGKKPKTEKIYPNGRGWGNKWIPSEKDLAFIDSMISVGLPVENICDALGIAVPTWYNEIKRDPEFHARVKKAKALAIASVANVLWKKATDPNNPNVTAAIFYLKVHAGWRDGGHVDSSNDPTVGHRLPTVRFMIAAEAPKEEVTIDCEVEKKETQGSAEPAE